jgi:hypothetical protein
MRDAKVTDLSPALESVDCGECTITHRVVRGWHLVIVCGDVSTASSPALTAMLDSIVADDEKWLIVDIARAATISPEVVKPWARLDTTLRCRGGDFRVVVDGVAALHAIREAGLSGRFEIHRYVGDIVGAVAGLDEGGRGRRRGGLTTV